MMDNKSIFRYKIIDNHRTPKEIVEKIDEELNRGLTFVVSQSGEKVVTLAGERKEWVTAALLGNDIYIYVNDGFFSSCVLEQILISLWANLLDFGEIRLEEFQLSDNIQALLTLGDLNRRSIQKLLGTSGPYFGTVFKPSFSLSLSEKLNIAERFASIGGIFLKEDETYLIERSKLLKEAESIQRVMNTVSGHCFYVPNVTPYLLDDSFFQELYEIGIRVVMINYLITGLSVVYKIIEKNKNLLFWGHRVGYKSVKTYISMKAVALLAVYSGMNMIHIGTPFFSENNSVREHISTVQATNKTNPNVALVFTKTSPQVVSNLIKLFGKNVIIMACGFIRNAGDLDWERVKRMIEIMRNCSLQESFHISGEEI